MSDNSKGYIIKAAAPVIGAQKSITNSVNIGMTRDTGHKYCKNNPEAPDLATPSYCAAGNIPQGGDRSNPWSMDDLRPSESGMPWPKLY